MWLIMTTKNYRYKHSNTAPTPKVFSQKQSTGCKKLLPNKYPCEVVIPTSIAVPPDILTQPVQFHTRDSKEKLVWGLGWRCRVDSKRNETVNPYRARITLSIVTGKLLGHEIGTNYIIYILLCEILTFRVEILNKVTAHYQNCTMWVLVLSCVLTGLLLLYASSRRKVFPLSGKHVMVSCIDVYRLLHLYNLSVMMLQITGGSSGIGKCLAVGAIKRGAAIVTLMARNKVGPGQWMITCTPQ